MSGFPGFRILIRSLIWILDVSDFSGLDVDFSDSGSGCWFFLDCWMGRSVFLRIPGFFGFLDLKAGFSWILGFGLDFVGFSGSGFISFADTKM